MDNNSHALIKTGDVIQANELAGEWAGCTCIVSEVKSFGVQAYLHIPFKGNAFIRLAWEQIEYIGKAKLVQREDNE